MILHVIENSLVGMVFNFVYKKCPKKKYEDCYLKK